MQFIVLLFVLEITNISEIVVAVEVRDYSARSGREEGYFSTVKIGLALFSSILCWRGIKK